MVLHQPFHTPCPCQIRQIIFSCMSFAILVIFVSLLHPHLFIYHLLMQRPSEKTWYAHRPLRIGLETSKRCHGKTHSTKKTQRYPFCMTFSGVGATQGARIGIVFFLVYFRSSHWCHSSLTSSGQAKEHVRLECRSSVSVTNSRRPRGWYVASVILMRLYSCRFRS